MQDSETLFEAVTKDPEEDCIQVYRYRESTYISGNGITTKTSWVLMKKLSCKKQHGFGKRCYGPLDDAHDANAESVDIQCNDPRDGNLYQAIFVAGAPDWETGYIDDWYWKMEPYELPVTENPG